MQGIYVAGACSRLLLQYLDQEQLDAPLLRERLLTQAVPAHIPITTWWQLLEQLTLLCPQPALGIHIGLCAHPKDFSVLGYLWMSCANVGQALLRFQRLQSLIHNLVPSHIKLYDEMLEISWEPSHGRSPLIANAVLISAVMTCIKRVTGRDDLFALAMYFPHLQPADAQAYTQLCGCPVYFQSDRLKLLLPLHSLTLPINSSDPQLMLLLEKQADVMLTVLPKSNDFMTALQRYLIDTLPDGEPSAENAAAHFHVSLRSLYRRLQEQQISFSTLLHSTRYALAKNYLQDDILSLSEIAALLGYSQQSAFSRAFKAWSGTTPQRYRQIRCKWPLSAS